MMQKTRTHAGVSSNYKKRLSHIDSRMADAARSALADRYALAAFRNGKCAESTFAAPREWGATLKYRF